MTLVRTFALWGWLLGSHAYAGSAPGESLDPSDCQSGNSSTAFAQVVIIIDDVGHSNKRGEKILSLPGNITYAIIPFTNHGQRLAARASSMGKEVMIHAPMSTVGNTPLERRGLTADLTRKKFLENLRAAFDNIPQAKGLNNHMGSELTQRRKQMAWLMQELRWRELYFVDSRTSEKTVAATVAADFNVPHLSRDVFLDNEQTFEAIDERFQALIARAKRDGIAVAIGHPHRATYTYLRDALPKLEEQGIRTAFVSEVLEAKEAEVLEETSELPCPPEIESEPGGTEINEPIMKPADPNSVLLLTD